MARLLTKLALLLGLVALVQVTLVGRIWHARVWQSKDLRDFKACVDRNPDVVYFCDSSNYWVDDQDQDRRAICQCLDALLVDATAASLDGGAFHAGIYEAFVDLMISQQFRPRALIIPVNLRSFSTGWDRNPVFAFDERIHQIRNANSVLASAAIPVLRTFQLVGESPVSLEEFNELPVFFGAKRAGRVLDFDNASYRESTPERIRNKFVYYYMYSLDEQHRKLAALRRISQKAGAAGLKVVFYISPLDVETGERVLPGEFRKQLEANIQVVLRALAGHQPPVLDLSSALPAQQFSWRDYPNEHLKQEGRQSVAGALARTLSEEMPPQKKGPGIHGRVEFRVSSLE